MRVLWHSYTTVWIKVHECGFRNAAHTYRPWRIHDLTRDFRMEDVWALPTPGGPDDFPRLVQQMASGDPAESSSRAARTLWAIRWKLGELLGWDRRDVEVRARWAFAQIRRQPVAERRPLRAVAAARQPVWLHVAPFRSLAGGRRGSDSHARLTGLRHGIGTSRSSASKTR